MEIWDDILTPAELTASARGYLEATEEGDITAALLPNEMSDDIRVEFDVVTGSGGRTEGEPLRAWDAESAIGGSRGAEKRYAEAVASSWKVRFGEYERLRRLNRTDSDSVSNAVQGRVREVTDVIVNRLRALRSEALLTGKLAINERGVVQNVDFGRRPDFTATAGTLWDATGADPLGDIETWVEAFAAENGIEPEVAVVGRSAAAALRAYFGDENGPAPLAVVQSRFDEEGLPRLVVNTNRRVLSQQHVILAVPGVDALGSTVWGPTAESQDERYGLAAADQPGLAVGLYTTTDPILWWVHGAAAYLPVLKNANLSFAARVLSA